MEVTAQESTDNTAQNGARTPLSLAGDGAWLLAEGHADIFAIMTKNGMATRARRHLWRAERGSALLPIEPLARDDGSQIELQAIGNVDTRWEPLELDEAQHRVLDVAPNAIIAALQQWIFAWAHSVFTVPQGSDARNLIAGENGELTKDSCAMSHTVLWIEADDNLRLCDDARETEVPKAEASKAQAPRARFPLGGNLLAVATENASFRALSLADWLHECRAKNIAPLDDLRAFHRYAMQVTAAQIAQEDARDTLRLQERATHNQTAMQSALGELSRVLEDDGARAHLDSDDLIAAIQSVGAAAGFAVVAPAAKTDNASLHDTIRGVARASHVRTRQVQLRDNWWNEDGGALLGFQGEKPVALLPTRPGRYEVFDPQSGAQTRVSARIARTISPMAYAWYRPLPDRVLDLRSFLWFGFRGSARDFGAMALWGVAIALLGLLPPLAIGRAMDTLIPGAQETRLLQLCAGLGVAAMAVALFDIVRGVALLRIETRLDNDLQSALWDRLLRLPVAFFRAHTAGELASRVLAVTAIRRTLSSAAVSSVLGGVFGVFNFVLLLSIDAPLALLVCGFALALAGLTWWLTRQQLATQRLLLRSQGALMGLVFQLVNGVGKLQVAGAQSRAFGRWSRDYSSQKTHTIASRSLNNTLAIWSATLPALLSLAIFASFSTRIGELSTGEFLAFSAASSTLLAALIDMAATLSGAVSVVPQFERLQLILDAQPEATSQQNAPANISGDIEVSHVSFRYASDAPLVLDDVSLRVQAGQFVAIVGPSGSGKSSLLRLLLRFDAPENGTILFDGQDIAGLDVEALRRQIGVVLQNGGLMPGSILDNIKGASSASIDDAWRAAKLAGIERDIRAMPMGMHTIVAEGGATFSGGQRQRLLIARALISQPRLLIFDEATSALDNATQAEVSRSLEELHTTRIVIAHRLSTIEHADVIYVIEMGRVVQSGTYDELKNAPGLFAELVRRQTTGSEV